MEFKDKMDELKRALSQEKLVIFIGAGVSKNSGIPTWGQMVRCFAEKIGYSQQRLTTEEYLKIPQYYYGIDKSPKHEDYYTLLKNQFDPNAKPNIINELIAKIHPRHIVTTNYDKLMDEVAADYEVIREDCDFIKSSSKNYLIKMHGDIDDVHSIVFKEDDYLQYFESHRLTEIFLKSLLIDHVFLFVGYSLNDKNIELFSSWIDYMAKAMNVQDYMHKNYMLLSSVHASKDYLISYYENKNIQVIDLNALPEEVEKRASEVPLEDELGRKTYAVLELLYKN
jgi:hypothetical protein